MLSVLYPQRSAFNLIYLTDLIGYCHVAPELQAPFVLESEQTDNFQIFGQVQICGQVIETM